MRKAKLSGWWFLQSTCKTGIERNYYRSGGLSQLERNLGHSNQPSSQMRLLNPERGANFGSEFEASQIAKFSIRAGKPINKKHLNKCFTALSRDYPDISWEVVYVSLFVPNSIHKFDLQGRPGVPLSISMAFFKTFISCYTTPGPQKGFRRGF